MKIYRLIFLLFICPFALHAQDDLRMQEQPVVPFKDRLVYGGNVGLSFGSITYILASPSVGYKLNVKTLVGVGFSYTYINYRDYAYETSAIGGRLFARYQIYQGAFAYSELEQLHFTIPTSITERVGKDATNFWVGGGYRSNWGERFGFTLMFLYNLNESPTYGFYTNPTLRVGFEF